MEAKMDNQDEVGVEIGLPAVEVKHPCCKNGLSKFMAKLMSITMTTTQVYFTLILLSIPYQLYTLLNDFRYHFKLLDYHFPSRRHTLSVMILHVATFYWSLLAGIYSFQCGRKRQGCLFVVAVILNLGTFLTRCIFEFMMLKYREEV